MRLLVVAMYLLALIPAFSVAQTLGQGYGPSVEIDLSPRFPSTGETVTATINDYSLGANSGTIAWFIDGVQNVAAENQRSIQMTAPALGETTTVRSVITLPSSETFTSESSFTSTLLDLLVEANTLTPSFYPGRALPTPGSQVRVTALPFTSLATDPNQYSYRWEVGGSVVDGGPVRGKNFTVFRSEFERAVEVSVTVFELNGSVVTGDTIFVPIKEPELYFYEVNPLRGLLPTALRDPHIFSGEELRLRAEPYYYDPTALREDQSHIEWELDNQTIATDPANPFEVTLRRQGAQGAFNLNFHIRNRLQLSQGIEDNITIRF